MLVREHMSSPAITVAPDAPIHDAEKLMKDHKIRHVPVVDEGKLVGIVTKSKLRGVAPSSATPLGVSELAYLLAKMKVKDVMEADVLTVTPDTSIERAVTLGQEGRVGGIPVVDGDTVVGVITNTDLFRIFTNVLAVGEGKGRLRIRDAGSVGPQSVITDIVAKNGVKILSMFYTSRRPTASKGDLTLNLDVEDTASIVAELKAKGYEVDVITD